MGIKAYSARGRPRGEPERVEFSLQAGGASFSNFHAPFGHFARSRERERRRAGSTLPIALDRVRSMTNSLVDETALLRNVARSRSENFLFSRSDSRLRLHGRGSLSLKNGRARAVGLPNTEWEEKEEEECFSLVCRLDSLICALVARSKRFAPRLVPLLPAREHLMRSASYRERSMLLFGFPRFPAFASMHQRGHG
jgi:hypothetical protein